MMERLPVRRPRVYTEGCQGQGNLLSKEFSVGARYTPGEFVGVIMGGPNGAALSR
jgi:hypothetical protein